jgi:hypothetical protein
LSSTYHSETTSAGIRCRTTSEIHIRAAIVTMIVDGVIAIPVAVDGMIDACMTVTKPGAASPESHDESLAIRTGERAR